MNIFPKNIGSRRGQSLIEILVAIAVGVVMIGVAVSIIAPVLRANTRTNSAKIAAALGRELLENVRVFTEEDWGNLAGLATSSLNPYYLTTSTLSPSFFSVSGVESIVISSTTYSRYFYVDEVCRTANGSLPQDPSVCAYVDLGTKRVTVSYGWVSGSSSTFSTYFTRYKSNSLNQSDWSGGAYFWGPATGTDRFVTSSNINFASTSRVLKIQDVYSE